MLAGHGKPAMVAKDANSLRTSLRRQRPPWRPAKTPAYFCLLCSFRASSVFPSRSRLREPSLHGPPPSTPARSSYPVYTHAGDTFGLSYTCSVLSGRFPLNARQDRLHPFVYYARD